MGKKSSYTQQLDFRERQNPGKETPCTYLVLELFAPSSARISPFAFHLKLLSRSAIQPPPPRTRIKSVICVVSVLPHLEFLVYLQLKRGGENQIFQSFHISISSQGKRAMYGNRIVVFAIVLLLVV